MIEHSTIFCIMIGLMITSGLGLIFYSGYDNLTLNHWIPQTIIAGIIIIPLTVCGGIIDDNNTKVENQLRTQLLPIMTMSSIITTRRIIKLLFPVVQGTHLIMMRKLKH